MINHLNKTTVRKIIPFRLELSLELVIKKWRKTTSPHDERLQRIEQTLKKFPYLQEDIRDIKILQQHQEFLQTLFSPLLPQTGWSNTMNSFCAPFAHDVFIIATEAYHKIFREDTVTVNGLESLMKGIQMDARVLYAYKAILKKFYQLDLKIDLPIIFSSYNSKSGLYRYFKLTGNTQFVDVVPNGELPNLDDQILQKLLDQDFDLKSWLTILPPQNFTFRGVTLTNLMDITTEESTKRLQFSLLNRDENNEAKWFESIQQEIRNLFRLPELRLGLATLQKNNELNFGSSRKIWNSLLIRELPEEMQQKVQSTFYHQVITSGKTLIFENLEDQKENWLANILVENGFRNLLLAPLYYGREIIGILELANPDSGSINGLSLFKINQVKPIFANALKRHLEEFENKVEAVMLEEFTAIHPAIQWKFRDAAIQLLDKNSSQEKITFSNLYPFYGSLDIRDSSKKRNQVIYQDLLDNLEEATAILRMAFDKFSLTILEELVFQIEQKTDKLRKQFSTEEEGLLAEFIRKQINPVIRHLGERYPEINEVAKKYADKTNSASKIFDRNRLAYDDALLKLNQCMAGILDEEEKELQKLVPCYFEKYQTDGIEYNIFMGESIAPGYSFNPLYIDNLRLRQLIWTCKIANKVRKKEGCQNVIKRQSKDTNNEVVLQIAPLILAYGSRITLKFRMDEKRLDVDGSYNIRYEIVKKRIDKAVIAGTKERLTQPDYISVVYTQENEVLAYRRHFEYLGAKGLLAKKWEELDLAPLPGVKGLKALRVKIL